jgi:hypothetical protein
MNSFYNPAAPVSFLTLRTNTEMFKPPHSAFKRPSIQGVGRQAHALPLQEQPSLDPEIPKAIIEQMMGDRNKQSIPKIGNADYPRQGGKLVSTAKSDLRFAE